MCWIADGVFGSVAKQKGNMLNIEVWIKIRFCSHLFPCFYNHTWNSQDNHSFLFPVFPTIFPQAGFLVYPAHSVHLLAGSVLISCG